MGTIRVEGLPLTRGGSVLMQGAEAFPPTSQNLQFATIYGTLWGSIQTIPTFLPMAIMYLGGEKM